MDDLVELLIESLTRHLPLQDDSDYIDIERGDGRALRRLPTYRAMLDGHFEKTRPYGLDGGRPLPRVLADERVRIQADRAKRVEEDLRARRIELAAFVEGDTVEELANA